MKFSLNGILRIRQQGDGVRWVNIQRNFLIVNIFWLGLLVTEKTCLVCHAKQGYKEGDIRGGISVTLPFTMKLPLISLISSHLISYVSGLLWNYVLGRKLKDS